MAKPDLGTKRVCPDTGRKFYDLNKNPVISPYTGKVVPIAAPAPTRARPEPASAARPAPVAESIAPETTDAATEGATAAGEEEEVEIDESLDDAAFIEEQEEGDADVTDIIGESIEKEEES